MVGLHPRIMINCSYFHFGLFFRAILFTSPFEGGKGGWYQRWWITPGSMQWNLQNEDRIVKTAFYTFGFQPVCYFFLYNYILNQKTFYVIFAVVRLFWSAPENQYPNDGRPVPGHNSQTTPGCESSVDRGRAWPWFHGQPRWPDLIGLKFQNCHGNFGLWRSEGYAKNTVFKREKEKALTKKTRASTRGFKQAY